MADLTKKQITQLRVLYTRHGRKKSNLCVCEGLRSCSELLAARPDLVEYSIATPEMRLRLSIPGEVYELELGEINKISGTVSSQGIIIVARVPDATAADDPCRDPFVLALDRVGDPGNFGTICRTAKAAGLTELWYTAGSVDPYSDKVIRSALGAQFSMVIREFSNLEELQANAAKHGYNSVCVSTPHGGENCFEAQGIFDRTVMVIGSEAQGAANLAIRRDILIPMPGNFESLNAAQAATILIFEYVRRTTTACEAKNE